MPIHQLLFAKLEAAGIVTDGLALHLDAGDSSSYPGTGTTWSDLTSNNLDFTLINGPAYNSGFGGYITFDGTNDYATLSSGWTSFGTDVFTIEAWYRAHSANTNHSLISTQGSGAGTFQLDHASDKDIRFKANTDTFDSTIAFSANTWRQIVFVREGTGTNQCKFYENGSLDSNGTIGDNFNSTAQLQLAYNRGSNRGPLDADISIIRIYKNKALTAAEVLNNFNVDKGRYSL
jgi:hypothetical protein